MIPAQTPGPLRIAEVMALIEFCVDLDSEDDRAAAHPRNIFNLRADRSLDLWDCVADSRGLAPAEVANDPVHNGFAPFDTAWTLWRRKAPGDDGRAVLALAFRGTVFGNKASVIEDAHTNTVAAHQGIELGAGQFLPITFATLPGAEVHEGFAYGIFSALFDGTFGALRYVQHHVPPGSTLLLTGHSQGAALATLAHAFFHYAATQGQFGIAGLRLTLRSHVFAQPRPGNVQFALDFAHVSGGVSSFAFNNTLDPVPLLPPSHSFAIEAFAALPGSKLGSRLVRALFQLRSRVHTALSTLFERSFAAQIAELQRHDPRAFLHAEALHRGITTATAAGGSQSYVVVGAVIPLHGFDAPADYFHHPADAEDAFVQHHAPVYRRLLEKHFALDVTDETSPQLRAPPPHLTDSLAPPRS